MSEQRVRPVVMDGKEFAVILLDPKNPVDRELLEWLKSASANDGRPK